MVYFCKSTACVSQTIVFQIVFYIWMTSTGIHICTLKQHSMSTCVWNKDTETPSGSCKCYLKLKIYSHDIYQSVTMWNKTMKWHVIMSLLGNYWSLSHITLSILSDPKSVLWYHICKLNLYKIIYKVQFKWYVHLKEYMLM